MAGVSPMATGMATGIVTATATAQKHPFAESLLRNISVSHQQVAEQVVSWWLQKMPDAYFREIDADTRLSHLRALIALQMTDQKQEVTLYGKDKSSCTIIKPGNYVGLLSEVISSLPANRPLREANIYTAIDGDLVVDVFEFDDVHRALRKFRPESNSDRVKQVFATHAHTNTHASSGKDRFLEYLSCCDESYVLNRPVRELRRHFELVDECQRTENVAVHFGGMHGGGSGDASDDDDEEQPGDVFTMEQVVGSEQQPARLMVVLKREFDWDAFPRFVQHLSRRGIDILKATLTRIENYRSGHYVVFTCNVRFVSGRAPNADEAAQLCNEMKRIPFVDGSVLRWVDARKELSLADAEVLVALSKMVHCLLAEDRPLVFTQYHIDQFMVQYREVVDGLLRFWHMKFAPLSKSSLSSRLPLLADFTHQLRTLIEKQIELEDCKLFFQTMVEVINATLKTNVHHVNRTCLMLRLNARVMRCKGSFAQAKSDLPFGIFFCLGRDFIGFHIRFRDIARGGMRLEMPTSTEQYTVSNNGLLMETYRCALAQQLKNKDIPEGGAVAILLLEPDTVFATENAAKTFADGLLDLTGQRDKEKAMADYFGEEEIIYLGPDENVNTDMITWICQRAIVRQHPFPGTFMSSKSGAGINHKDFAVTAEGLSVYLDVALRHIGVDPRQQTFTVKMTGGPDGVVAGNVLRILRRDYGEFARVVAIADSSGVAEDPQGLHPDELLRLVNACLPITEFSKSKLSSRGHIISICEGSGSGVKTRNSMPFRVNSDVFIAAGGRPDSMNDSNWKQYFSESGVPSSRLILEGTTNFISKNTRERLSANGVVILRDSSATKCGVICSSYEILAGMLLNEAEFLSVKGSFVSEVLSRLRHLAKLEALITFKEYHRQFSSAVSDRKSLPEISCLISKAIIKVKDAIFGSGYLDLYTQPLPDVVNRKSTGNFYIAANVVEEEVPSEQLAPLLKQADQLGLKYQPEFHKLCRELLVEYLPPSLRAFGNAKMTAMTPPTSRTPPAPPSSTSLFGGFTTGDPLAVTVDNITQASPALSVQKRPSTRLDSILPLVYKKRILATALACKIIYNEGVHFLDATLGMDIHAELQSSPIAPPCPSLQTFGSQQNLEYTSKIAEWSFRYLMEYERTSQLIEKVQQAQELDPGVRERLIMILERGGTRIGVELHSWED